MYRSFIICDDPKGVVECGTTRKCKNAVEKTEHRTGSGKPRKHSTKDLKHKSKETEKEETNIKQTSKKTCSTSSSQVLEIAKGAQKLNRMIDAWSKGVDFKNQSQDIAEGLLKGALDLQESLAMLGKLQETSRHMAMSKKKQEVNTARASNDEVVFERTNLNRYEEVNYHKAFQKPRLSADGYSRNRVEDLKHTIRSSLARQNSLAVTGFEHKSCLYQRNLDFASEMPSTSSSQSSLVHSDMFDSIDSSISSTVPENKVRGPNLVAKLMGLEEMPSKPFQTTFKKQLESEKFFNQKRPIFDSDLRAARKSPHAALKSDPERRKLNDIHEAMPSKRLLKVDSGKCLKSRLDQSSDSHPQQSLFGDKFPIVLIKPLRVSRKDAGRPVAPMLHDSEGFTAKKISRRQVIKGKPSLEKIYSKEATFAVSKIGVKVEAEETPVERLSQEGSRVSKSTVRKPSIEEGKNIKNVASSTKATGPLKHTLRKEEENEKKSDKIEKTRVSSGRTAEKETPKSRNVSRPQDRANLTATKQQNPDDGSRIAKNQTSQQQSKSTARDKRKRQIRKNKPGMQSLAANLYADEFQCEDHDEKIDHKSDNDANLASNFNRGVHEIPTERRTLTKFQTEDDSRQNCDQNTICSVFPETYGSERHFKLTKAAQFHISNSIKDGEAYMKNLKYFLLSSQSFLSHAKEFFDVYMNFPVISQACGIKDSGITDVKLSLDCANELVERRSFQDSYTVFPLLLTSIGNSRICLRLDQLVEEVCNGIKFLRSYKELSGEDLSVDAYAMLDKDLAYQNFTGANWDMGWRNGFTVSDAEEVVSTIEKMVLNQLIEELYQVD